MRLEPLLVWGAGAIGGTAGAFLARAGHAVHFVDIVPEHVDCIRDWALAWSSLDAPGAAHAR